MRRTYKLLLLSFILLCCFAFQQKSFKEQQMKAERVKTAYKEKSTTLDKRLSDKSIKRSTLQVFIRVFKKEAQLELWVKNVAADKYSLLTTYDICSSSGTVGPKRKEGDMQVPEGFYQVNVFNPWSNFYLSLGINYPNASDNVLSDKKKPGGSIFIHGDCVTIGCMPLTDDKIKEVYVLCVEAKNNGKEIPVHIFPCRMDGNIYGKLKSAYSEDADMIAFWENLKSGYDYFEINKKLPAITVNKKGQYQFR